MLGRVALRTQARKLCFEFGLAGTRRDVLRGESFEFALEVGALDVRALEVRAMLIDLRFDIARFAPRMRQFAFECG